MQRLVALAAAVSAVTLAFSPYRVLAACSSWSSLYQDNLDGTCVCNETQCDSVSNAYLELIAGHVGVYTTSQTGARLQYKGIKVDASPVSSPTFSIDVSTQYQSIIGFGAAFTDSAAINVYKLSPKLQNILLDQEGDLAMENFSIEVDKAPNSHKIELIQRVLKMTSRDIKLLRLLQNEPEKPLLAFAKWRTLRITPEEERDFIKFDLGPMMAKNHPSVKIIANDDQKPSILSRLAPLEDPDSLQYISGVAVHWYRNVDFVFWMGGHFDDLEEFHDSYPNLFILQPKNVKGTCQICWVPAKGLHSEMPTKVGLELGGQTGHGAGHSWRAELVQEFCRSPILVDAKNAGSRRIKMSLTEDEDSDLKTCAFVTPESQVVIQFLNRKGSEEVPPLRIRRFVAAGDRSLTSLHRRSRHGPPGDQAAAAPGQQSLSALRRVVRSAFAVHPARSDPDVFVRLWGPAGTSRARPRPIHKQKWLTDERFLEVLSIASAIPGPSSTMTIAAMGLFRAGPLGGLLALFFWVLPGWIALTVAGFGAKSYLQGTCTMSEGVKNGNDTDFVYSVRWLSSVADWLGPGRCVDCRDRGGPTVAKSLRRRLGQELCRFGVCMRDFSYSRDVVADLSWSYGGGRTYYLVIDNVWLLAISNFQ
ncbi:hypothetical protein ON010_g9192 [Phytophthora cinnamomi]|nr:hypothetical protein ON010_g9192 [Phytophthora cinnamomi]